MVLENKGKLCSDDFLQRIQGGGGAPLTVLWLLSGDGESSDLGFCSSC